jgi:hypothetical protein
MMLPLRIELAMTLKAVFPDVLALRPAGGGCPGRPGAVSGRNILILAVCASALLIFGAAG